MVARFDGALDVLESGSFVIFVAFVVTFHIRAR